MGLCDEGGFARVGGCDEDRREPEWLHFVILKKVSMTRVTILMSTGELLGDPTWHPGLKVAVGDRVQILGGVHKGHGATGTESAAQ